MVLLLTLSIDFIIVEEIYIEMKKIINVKNEKIMKVGSFLQNSDNWYIMQEYLSCT